MVRFTDIESQNWLNNNKQHKNEAFRKGFLNKCEQIYSFLRICSHVLRKTLTENFIFCGMTQNNDDT